MFLGRDMCLSVIKLCLIGLAGINFCTPCWLQLAFRVDADDGISL